jgi:hypothetical protein
VGRKIVGQALADQELADQELAHRLVALGDEPGGLCIVHRDCSRSFRFCVVVPAVSAGGARAAARAGAAQISSAGTPKTVARSAPGSEASGGNSPARGRSRAPAPAVATVGDAQLDLHREPAHRRGEAHQRVGRR